MMKLRCDALLFDLDGVLIDSTSCITRHWATWAGQHGLVTTVEELLPWLEEHEHPALAMEAIF